VKKIVFVFTITVFFVFSAVAGEIYTWVDKNGVENITTTPPPANAKVKNQSTFKSDNPYEIERFRQRQKAATNRGFAGWQKSQARAYKAPTPSLTDSQKKQRELWTEHDKATKEYYKAQYDGDKTPAHRDPKRKEMFDTMSKAMNYQLSQ
jgi:hypothetical protein